MKSYNTTEPYPAGIMLRELINIEAVQAMIDSFYKISRIPMSLIDLDGKILVGVGWQDICTKFHRKHPETSRNCFESDLILTSDIPKGEFRLYKCRNGMWDMATPLYCGDRRIGLLITGQFFFSDEKIDFRIFADQAIKYDFEPKEYLLALRNVPAINREDVENAKTFFVILADTLTQLGYNKRMLEKSVEETKNLVEDLRKSKMLLEKSQAIAHLGSWELDLNTNKLTWSEEVFRIFGIEPGSAEFSYDDFLSLVHPEDRELVAKVYTDSVNSGESSYEIEHRIIRRNTGEIRYLHEKCEHFRDQEGKIISSVGMVQDITGRTN